MPEKIHIGSITRFIKPLTVSVFLARLAIKRPIPAKDRAPTISTTAISQRWPRIGMPNLKTPRASSTATSGIRNVNRASRMASRKSRLGMGVAVNRLSSLPIRKLTIRKPTPQRPPPMVF
jgi:hypothetical protein